MLKQDQLDEIERIERRNKRIQELLNEEPTSAAVADRPAEAVQPEPSRQQPTLRPPLQPWERVINGRREQYRKLTLVELEAEAEREFLKNQWNADQEHAAKVKAAEREQAKEAKYLKDKREKEARTGKRRLTKDTISLEEARARGLIGQSSGSDNNGRPEWWSEKNPTGLMGAG